MYHTVSFSACVCVCVFEYDAPAHVEVSVILCGRMHACTSVSVLCSNICIRFLHERRVDSIPMRRCSSPLRPCVCQHPVNVCIFMLPKEKTRKSTPDLAWTTTQDNALSQNASSAGQARALQDSCNTIQASLATASPSRLADAPTTPFPQRHPSADKSVHGMSHSSTESVLASPKSHDAVIHRKEHVLTGNVRQFH